MRVNASLSLSKPDLLSILGNIFTTSKLTKTQSSYSIDLFMLSILSSILLVFFIFELSPSANGYNVFSTFSSHHFISFEAKFSSLLRLFRIFLILLGLKISFSILLINNSTLLFVLGLSIKLLVWISLSR